MPKLAAPIPSLEKEAAAGHSAEILGLTAFVLVVQALEELDRHQPGILKRVLDNAKRDMAPYAVLKSGGPNPLAILSVLAGIERRGPQR
jgi:hypothetical protein